MNELTIQDIDMPFDLENCICINKLNLEFNDIPGTPKFDIMKEKTKVVVKELKIIAYDIIHILWALSRVQVKKSLEIIVEFSLDNEPINLLIINILRRVNPDYGYKLKIVAK